MEDVLEEFACVISDNVADAFDFLARTETV